MRSRLAPRARSSIVREQATSAALNYSASPAALESSLRQRPARLTWRHAHSGPAVAREGSEGLVDSRRAATPLLVDQDRAAGRTVHQAQQRVWSRRLAHEADDVGQRFALRDRED